MKMNSLKVTSYKSESVCMNNSYVLKNPIIWVKRSLFWQYGLMLGNPGEHVSVYTPIPHNCSIVLTIRWPCVCVQVSCWMWWMDESWAQRWDSFKVQAGKAWLGAVCTRLRNLILLRLFLFFSCLGFLPENKQRDLWRNLLHMQETAFLELLRESSFLWPT